jgi:hypothetical protein
MGYYQPTSSMTAKDLQQLVKGITYPHNVYYGNKFAPEDNFPIDVELTDQPFYPRTANVKGITFDGTRYVAVADSGEHSFILVSEDGRTWTNQILSPKVLNVTDITWTGREYIVSTLDKLTPLLVSFDTENWATVGTATPFDGSIWDQTNFDTSPISCPADSLNSVVYLNGFYFATGSGLLRSVDGITWEQVFSFNSQLLNELHAITYVTSSNFEGFVAVGGGYEVVSGSDTSAPAFTSVSRIVTSVDGNEWTLARPHITTANLYAVASSDTTILVAGENAEIWLSVNGNNWVKTSVSPVTATLRDAIFANGTFVIVGDGGTILTSTDGESWTKQSSPTTDNLFTVTTSDDFFYAAGDNALIIRSEDGIAWENISYITSDAPFSTVKGSDFLYGYGPEELVAGVITDTLSMKVITTPGASWDDESEIQSKLYENTGFMMTKFVAKPTNGTISFSGVVNNPVQVSLFVINDVTGVGRRIYETSSTLNPLTYSIDWASKVIELSDDISQSQSIMVEVYEFGNGRQLIRSSTDYIPIREDAETGRAEMLLNVEYNPLTAIPVMYKDGVRMQFPTDYYVTFAIGTNNLAKFVLNADYADIKDSYLTFALMDTSVNDLNPTEYSYSVPETELFVGNDSAVYSLTNNLLGDNADNAIVEVDGIRLANNTDYTIDTLTKNITFMSMFSSEHLIAVTTYNDTGRQYLQTGVNSNMQVVSIVSFDNTATPAVIVTSDELSLGTDFLCRIDGINIDAVLHDVTVYVKLVDENTYELYNDANRTVGFVGPIVESYDGNGYIWQDAMTFQVAQPIDNVVLPNTPLMVFTDPTRTWVTVKGKRLAPEHLFYQPAVYTEANELVSGNRLSILTSIGAGDEIQVTSMVNGASPDQMTFVVTVDRKGAGSVYRANDPDVTWLTREINTESTSVYVKDVLNLTDSLVQTRTITNNGVNDIVFVDCKFSSIRGVTVINNTTGDTLDSTSFEFTLTKNKPAVVFTSGVSVGDVVTVYMRIGEIIEINGERIRYTTLDPVTNSVSGLTRGVLGTSPVEIHTAYSSVLGITPARKLDDVYYGVTWNTNNSDTLSGDPLQISTTPAATFLKYGHY